MLIIDLLLEGSLSRHSVGLPGSSQAPGPSWFLPEGRVLPSTAAAQRALRKMVSSYGHAEPLLQW